MITDTQTALDLIAEAQHFHDSKKMAVPMECLPDHFFDLKSGVAGEMLQKFVNYNCKVAIYGDHSKHKSGPLNDFIRESNAKGDHVVFPASREEALDALHDD
jgi:hypothetical protein